MAETFTPVLYLKNGCPFCFKLRVFLLDAGLLDRFTLREFTEGTAEEHGVRTELSPHFEKVSFPTAQISSGRYKKDSDALIAHYADEAKVDPTSLGTFQAYVNGPFNTIMSLFKENKDLKKRAA